MSDAYPMLRRCAARQLREDPPMYAHLLEQAHAELLRPNLLLETRSRRPTAIDPREEHGTLVPMLSVKAG
jgi:hypothetical protein